MTNEKHEMGKARLVRETEKAILVKLEDGTEKWIPKSQVHEDSEVFGRYKTMAGGGVEGKLVVTKYWAEKNGLVDD